VRVAKQEGPSSGFAAWLSGEDEVARLRAELSNARREADDAIAARRAMERDQQTFLALVAHQLKSPLLPLEVSLRTIHCALDRGRELPPDTLARTHRQVRRLNRAIDALLVDLPRAEDGSLTVSMTELDLREPVRAAIDELRILMESRMFDLVEPPDPVIVRADRDRVHSILASLIDNAVKYSPPGRPVCVEVVCAEQSATVSVVDQGIGIPKVELGQIFSKFYRASNAPSYLYRGLGVGLYLAHRFAELCHGALRIESEEGKGTRSSLVLPLAA
jgi:signal transduction histidine kinase